jgi:uncharacterized protein YdeI (BOF family)
MKKTFLNLKGVCWRLLLFSMTMFFSVATYADHGIITVGPITFDGNPAEWPAALANPANNSIFIIDEQNTKTDDIFVLGSADTSPISGWTWRNQGANDKNDIKHVGIILHEGYLLFAVDRFANNGDAQLGIWILKDRVLKTGGPTQGGFTGEHMDGDILLRSHFVNGGGVAERNIYIWQGGPNGGPVLANLPQDDLDFTANQVTYPVPSPWVFKPKFGADQTYPQNSFIEGFINLNALLGDDIDLCFATFLIETGQSTSINSSLEDIVSGEFGTIPDPPLTLGDERCGPGVVTLQATRENGNQLVWYADEDLTMVVAGDVEVFEPFVSETTPFYVTQVNTLGCESQAAMVMATVNPNPEISLSGTDLLCFDDGSGEIEVSWTSGTGPFDLYLDGELHESDVTSPFDITGLAAGDYTVRIVDANGCYDEDMITLDEPDLLVISLVGTDLLCFEDGTGAIEVTFSGGTGPFDLFLDGVLYASGVTSPYDITGLAAGDFNVEVVDANGCKADDDVTLSEPDELLISLDGTDLLCFEDGTGAIEVTFSGGTGPFDLFLDGVLYASGVTSPYDITGLAAGDYNVEVVDANGCKADDDVTLSEPDELLISLDGTDLLCFEDGTGEIEVTFSGGTGPFDLFLDGVLYASGVTSPYDITGLAAGDYNVEVVDANGCIADDDVTLSEPDELLISLVGTDLLCFEDGTGEIEVTFSGGTGPFDLFLDGVLYASGVTSPYDITGLAAGDYNVEVVDANGCKADDDVTLYEPELLECTIELVSDASCGGADGVATVTVTGGTGPFSIVWSNGEEGETAYELTPGLHSVTVTDANGCETTCEVEVGEEPCIVDCETFYAKAENGICFIDGGFSSNWGWTNLIGPGTYEWPLYADAGECILEGATLVGTTTVVYGLDGVVTVTIDMAPGYTLEEEHIYAGYAPYPGPGIGTWRNEGPFDGSDIYVIVHGVVCGNFSKSAAAQISEMASVGEISLSVGPNPFRDQASIRVISEVDTKASVEVYNMLGVRVATLHEGALNAHEVYNFNFTANSRSQQFYMVVVRTPFGVTSSKILQVR